MGIHKLFGEKNQWPVPLIPMTCPLDPEAEELFAEAQKMAQLRYKTYIRKAAENWED